MGDRRGADLGARHPHRGRRPPMSAVMRFAWYGRLSTKDKQDPTLSFPSQREACERKAAELAGRIACDFTDQESGRRDDRASMERTDPRGPRPRHPPLRRRRHLLDLAGSARDLFHALAFERELARAGCAGLLRHRRRRPDEPRGAPHAPHVSGARPVRGREARPRGPPRADRERPTGLPQRRASTLRLPATPRAAPRPPPRQVGRPQVSS